MIFRLSLGFEHRRLTSDIVGFLPPIRDFLDRNFFR
jgi:hypothetical protein